MEGSAAAEEEHEERRSGRPSLLLNASELQQAAQRGASSAGSRVQERVDWDINVQSLQTRLEPYRFELLATDGQWLEIQQSAGKGGRGGTSFHSPLPRMHTLIAS